MLPPRRRRAAALALLVAAAAAAALVRVHAQQEPCITTVAGNGGTPPSPITATGYAAYTALQSPMVHAMDAARNVAFAYENNKFGFRRIDLTAGTVAHLAGVGTGCSSASVLVGPALTSSVCAVTDLHYDAERNMLLFTEVTYHHLRALALDTGT